MPAVGRCRRPSARAPRYVVDLPNTTRKANHRRILSARWWAAGMQLFLVFEKPANPFRRYLQSVIWFASVRLVLKRLEHASLLIRAFCAKVASSFLMPARFIFR